MDEHKSLDNETDDEPQMFYFASSENIRKIYSITEKQAMLSDLFKTTIENEHAEKTTELTPLILDVVSQPDESFFGSDVYYKINTVPLLRYVVQYLNLWSNELDKSDYCVEEPVTSGDPAHYLKPKDLGFIESFISAWKTNTNEFDEKLYESDPNYSRMVRIRTLAQLISQVDNYLGLDSLAKKLYTYTATIVWNTSIVDISEVEADPEFKKLQQDAVAMWKLHNPEKSTHYVTSVTTGDGQENDDNHTLTDLIENDD